jgi:hypothetical protein
MPMEEEEENMELAVLYFKAVLLCQPKTVSGLCVCGLFKAFCQ